MSQYNSIKATINANIKANNNQEITGNILNSVLNEMIDSLASGYLFKGIATTSTNPGNPDENVFYLGGQGTYTNFGGAVIPSEHLGVLKYNGSWTVESVLVGRDYDNAIAALEWAVDPLFYYTELTPQYPSPTTGVTISAGKWTSQPLREIYLITYTYSQGDKLRIKGHPTNGSYYAFLTSDQHTIGQNVPFCNPGESSWTNVAADVTSEVAIPSNCACIAINSRYNSSPVVNFEPAILEIISKHRREVTDTIEENSKNILTSGGAASMYESLYGEDVEVTIGNQDATSDNYVKYTATQGGITRAAYKVLVASYTDFQTQVSVNANSAIKAAIQYWEGNTYDTYIQNTGWANPGESVSLDYYPGVRYVAIVTTYVSGNTGQPTYAEFMENVTFTVTASRQGEGLVSRVETLETPKSMTPRLYEPQIETNQYYGEKVDFGSHEYSFSTVGTLQSGVSSRQGGAVYGDYFFQFHNTLQNICVFDLSTGTNVQKITLTPIADCHANSGAFSSQFYDPADSFPLLYISSMEEKKVYVFRITGTPGSLALSLIQTITLTSPYFLLDIAIDTWNNRLVIYGYTKNDGLDGTDNETIVMTSSIPSTDADVTIQAFDGLFHIPFVFAVQGAFARLGKLYLSYGNCGSPYYNGGLLVIDYLNKAIINVIGLSCISAFEPEGIGLWGTDIVISSQTGTIYKLTF